LLGRRANFSVVLRFALPAAAAAFFGAYVLTRLATTEALLTYHLGERLCSVTFVKLIVGFIILVAALFELLPGFTRIAFSPKAVPLGGFVSGFLGGLSGHQGALRSAVLVRLGLEKEVFVATSVVSAVIVDICRLLVYGLVYLLRHFDRVLSGETANLVLIGCFAAFVGSVVGVRLLKKVTIRFIHTLIGVLLFLVGGLLMVGVL
jgi:uncharacterized membrane protein YfcA